MSDGTTDHRRPGQHPRYWGVTYDVGTNFATGQGGLSRQRWSIEAMRSELTAIRRDLHCNSVTIYGSDLDRLAAAASFAAEQGLHVWLQPRLVDQPQDDTIDHLAEAARLAQSLRTDGAAVGLAAGCVNLVFTPGIADGQQYHERMANVFPDAEHKVLVPTGRIDTAAAGGRLNRYLARAAAVCRANFAGRLTYSAAPFEPVDWTPFDIVGLMHFYTLRYPPTHQQQITALRAYDRWDKPVMIAEFGTATWSGAPEKAFLSFDIVDRHAPVHTVLDGHRRDERTQAAFHQRMLSAFAEARMFSVAVSEFIHPTHPYSEDPRLDLDSASMALVKTIRAEYADSGSAYRWEPKESFHALANRYRLWSREA